MKKILTVTVGIPAYNEEQNIVQMLYSVLKQRSNFYQLEKVIVICDGCTDETSEKVSKLSQRYPFITLFNDGKRIGKSQRLNQLYRMNKSDILVTLDADLLLVGIDEIEKLVVPIINNEGINLVSGNIIPAEANSLVGKINNAGHRLWDEVRMDVNGGNHIHNISGGVSALRGSFAQNVVYPQNILSDSGYIYISAISYNYDSFYFAKNVRVLFRAASTIEDSRKLATRAIFNDKENLAEVFGEDVYQLYKIPMMIKIKSIMKMLLLDPVFTTLSILLSIYVRKFPMKEKMVDVGLWAVIGSSKRI